MKKVFHSFFILVLGFALAIFAFPHLIGQTLFVTIEVINSAKKDINEIRIICPEKNYVQLFENLPKGDKVVLDFHAPGESTYSLKIIFADKSELIGKPHYVEPGYKVTATIFNDKIKSDYDFY